MHTPQRQKTVDFSTWLVCVYILSVPLSFIALGGLGSISKYLALLPVGYILMFRLQQGKIRFFAPINSMLLFLFISIIACGYTAKLDTASSYVFSLVLNFGLIIICSSVVWTEKEIQIFKNAAVIAGIFCVLLVVFFSETKTEPGRTILLVAGSRQDPNELCGYFIFGALCFFNGMLYGKRKFSSFLGFLLMLLPVFQTGSRGGMIAFLGSLLVFWVVSIYAKRREITLGKFIAIFLGACLIIAILLAIYFYWLPDDLRQRFTWKDVAESGGAGRFKVWEELLGKFETAPALTKFFGNGTGSITSLSSTGHVAHNVYIEALAEVGLVGLVILLCLHLSFLKVAWSQTNKIYFAALFGYLFMGFSLSITTYKPLFLIYLFILISENQRTSALGDKDYAGNHKIQYFSSGL